MPYVENAFVRADSYGSHGEAFNDSIRERFQQHSVHERPGIALITVADDILHLCRLLPRHAPLGASRKTGAAASTQTGSFYASYQLLGGERPAQFSRAAVELQPKASGERR